jgi:hypothetical protein
MGPRLLRAIISLIGTLTPIPTSHALAQCETTRFRSPYQGFASYLGNSVAVSGDTAAASGLSPGGARTAFVYERSASGWALTAALTGGQHMTSFHTKLALDGDTLLLGNIDAAAEAGEVHVFERTGGTFALATVLVPTTTRPDSHFGRRLALDGDRAVVAAPMDATYAHRGGAVFVFERQAGVWTETARIDPPAPVTFGFFGLSVALKGDLLVVGQPGADHLQYGVPTSMAHIYRRSGAAWLHEVTIQGPHGGEFGYAVAIANDSVYIGAPRAWTTGTSPFGAVYEYSRLSGSWQLAQSIGAASVGTPSFFGRFIVCDGERLVVAPIAAEGGGSSELVIVMHRDGSGLWRRQSAIAPPTPVSGYSGTLSHGAEVALDGSMLWAGSPGEGVPPTTWPAPAQTEGALYLHHLPPDVSPYCAPQVANSHGGFADLALSGCTSGVPLQVRLRASGMPQNSLGLLLLARPSGSIQVGGGVVVCLGSPATRFVSQAGSSGPSGAIEVNVDLGALPPGAGPTVAVPGETLRFQLVYRDSSPMAPLNVTNGLALVVP